MQVAVLLYAVGLHALAVRKSRMDGASGRFAGYAAPERTRAPDIRDDQSIL